MKGDRRQRIAERLAASFAPEDLVVKDQSHLHAGHAGAQEGKGHFDVRIVSNAFAGKSLLQRHRLVYDALDGLMEAEIHALKIQAKTPDEV